MTHYFEPSLSFASQPGLQQLFETVCDVKDPRMVTLICGAGVSIESGMPTWSNLVKKMTRSVPAEWRSVLRDDPVDLMRKVEYIFRNPNDQRRTPEEIVRDALYDKSGLVSPGSLADAIARLTVQDPKKYRIATTNFDTCVETALTGYLSSSVEDLACGIRASKPWFANKKPRPHVLHLHGMVTPHSGHVITPLILSESHFRRFGEKVQSKIEKIIRESHVVFVGVSLTDPNLLGPLHNLRKTRSPMNRVFVVVTPDRIPSHSDRESFDYACWRASYLRDELGVIPVFLKAHSQVPQLLYDLSTAARNPKGYFSDNASSSTRYGHRLQRTLDGVYSNLGANSDNHITGKAAWRFSRKIRNVMDKGPVHHVQQLIDHSWHDEQLAELGLSRTYLDGEHFGLFLWCRTPRASAHDGTFSLRLTGTSSFVHHEPWSARPDTVVVSNSDELHIRCAYTGRVIQGNLQDSRARPIWRSGIAVPIVTQDAKNGSVLTIGVATLHSTRRVVRPTKLKRLAANDVDVPNTLHPSAWSLLDRQEFLTLTGTIAQAAGKALGVS